MTLTPQQQKKIESWNKCKLRSAKNAILKKSLQKPLQRSQRSTAVRKQGKIKPGNRNAKDNEIFYRDCWNSVGEDHRMCNNCGIFLLSYSASFIAHILSRGAHPKIKYHPLNWILLCQQCHTDYDHGRDKQKMNIWAFVKERIIELLKIEYPSK